MSKLMLEEDKLRSAMRKFRAVSHPKRLEIIVMLTDLPKMNVTQIYTQLKLDQPAVSFHLKLLKMSGILIGKREGKEIYYSLNKENLVKLIDCIDRINK